MKKHDKTKNLKPIDNSDEKINAAKSQGQIQKRKEYNVRCTIRTLLENKNCIEVAFNTAINNAKSGKAKELIELIKLGCENEKQEFNLTNKQPPMIIEVANEKDKEMLEAIANVRFDRQDRQEF